MKKYLTDVNNKIYIKENIINYKNIKCSNIINVYPDKEITRFYGLGSAVTESSGYNYQQLNNDNKKNFIHDYFSKDGLNFNYGRLSIGSNDFSLKSFSYSKKKDLTDFSICNDNKYVIPFLKDILKEKKISLIASPWSPPKMYKRLPFLCWGIKLSKKYYEKYTDYLIKYIKEYEKLGIDINYLTMQNEPVARQRWESCLFNISEQKDFIYNYLIKKLDNTKLLLWDHNKDDLYNIINSIYEENEKVSGFAFHYYTGHNFEEIRKLREKFPNKLLINTEMCCAYSLYDEKKWLSSAEYYLKDIIGDMNCGVNAYLDWNILLDSNGGPTHKHNYVKSPSVRIDDNYVKSPIYYYLYHVSHFIDKKTVIIENKTNTNLKVVSLKTKKNIIIIVMNCGNNDTEFNILINKKNLFDKISRHSIVTYVLN